MSERVAVVTGGSGGVGTAICAALAKAGHKVVSADVIANTADGEQWQNECRNAGVSIGLVHMDVTDFDSCRGALAEVEANYGPVDILVNCAGITRDGTFKRMTVEQWQAVVDELERLDHRLYANALRWHLGIHHPFFKPENATVECRQIAIRNFRDEGVVAPEKLMNYIIPLPRSKDAATLRV